MNGGNLTDNDPSDQPPTTHTVVVEGCFGTVTWTVCRKLWDIMPTDRRIAALTVTGDRELAAFFRERAMRLLAQVGKGHVSLDSLPTEWSLETVEEECTCFGQLYWQISQGLWDQLPADQRENLLELVKDLIHAFMRDAITQKLFIWSARRL